MLASNGSKRLKQPEVPLSVPEVPVSAEQIRDVTPLLVAQKHHHADLFGLPFQTTAELEPIDGIVGQKRAVDAITTLV